MSGNKELYLKYGPRNLLWLMDHYNDIHIRFSAELDREIDGELMEKAWEKTVRVYPAIGCVIEMEGKELFFYKADGENKAIKSKAVINPGSRLVSGCVVTATYYGNRVSVSAYHTMVDGGGLNEIFKTLLYFYISSYTGTYDEPVTVQTAEGRAPEEYYRPVSPDELGDFTPVPLHTVPYLREFAEDADMEADEDGNKLFASVRFSADAFIGKCKEIGANPTAMLALLTSKAFYALNPGEQKDIFFEITTSVRKIFGAEGCISNCTSDVIADVCYDDVNGDVKDFVKKFRAEMDSQRSADYVKTKRQLTSTYELNPVNKKITLTYIGSLDIGENTKNITDFEMVTNAAQLLMLMQLGDEFRLMLEFGKATQKYIDKISELLRDMGIEVKPASELHRVAKDSDEQIL
ncbi:MAG: hypothetical protein J1F60_04470 [Oscillospiraceae bacterium]|nr:hypothetical protein [Oscillospiraceae bacterium]